MTYQLLTEWLDDIESGELERCPAARILVFDAFKQQAEQLAQARDALEAVEYSGASGHCPWCFGDVSETKDHAPDCQRQAALAALEKLTIY